MHAEMAKKRDAEGRLFFSFRTDNPNGKLLPLDTIRSWLAQAATQQKKANRQRGARTDEKPNNARGRGKRERGVLVPS